MKPIAAVAAASAAVAVNPTKPAKATLASNAWSVSCMTSGERSTRGRTVGGRHESGRRGCHRVASPLSFGNGYGETHGTNPSCKIFPTPTMGANAIRTQMLNRAATLSPHDGFGVREGHPVPFAI
jgi:hypothetical protein